MSKKYKKFVCRQCGLEQERWCNAKFCNAENCHGWLRPLGPPAGAPTRPGVMPRWVRGKPDGTGLWLIQTTNGDHAAALVEKTGYVGHDGEYLAVVVDGDSEELANCEWASWSFGPIPKV